MGNRAIKIVYGLALAAALLYVAEAKGGKKTNGGRNRLEEQAEGKFINTLSRVNNFF